MKQRVVKKWINRYITPMIEDLPRRNTPIGREDGTRIVLINGEIIPDGNAFRIEHNPKRAVQKQMEGLRKVLNGHSNHDIYIQIEPKAIIENNQKHYMSPEFWRKNPRKLFYGIGMRLYIK